MMQNIKQYTVGSAFSGIGGFELGFVAFPEFVLKFQIENNDFCRAHLQNLAPAFWPQSTLYGDIKDVKLGQLESVDVLLGGFPCTDISNAGKRRGIGTNTRSGLWWEFLRIIRDIRPRVVILENSSTITTLGGLEVVGSLAANGYDSTWITLRASDFGASHVRARWFNVAILGDAASKRQPQPRTQEHARNQAANRKGQANQFGDANGNGRIEYGMGGNSNGLLARIHEHKFPAFRNQPQHPWEPPINARPDEWTQDRLTALGNAVLPQISAFFAEIILNYLTWMDS